MSWAGSDTNRTITLTPLANQLGTASITVTVTDGDGMSTNNTFLLTVGLAPLTVNIDSLNRSYGATNPVLTGSLVGVLPGDGITLSLATAATTASPIGSYAIVPSLNDPVIGWAITRS